MSFFDTDRWNEIWQTIARNRKRSIMTALGVFWGIFMLTVMLGAGMGLGRLFRAQLGDMSTNTLLMQPEQTGIPYKGMPKNRWWRMTTKTWRPSRNSPKCCTPRPYSGATKCIAATANTKATTR